MIGEGCERTRRNHMMGTKIQREKEREVKRDRRER